jgi:hypothetical protein
MDSSRFDKLTKALATSTSRRQALKTIAATTLGSILGLGGIGTAFGASKCHRNGTGCDTNSQCCSGYCANGEKCTCPPAPACNSICPCPSGQTCVNGSCCSNDQVCGSTCGCPSGQVCQNGQCVTPCTASGGTCSGNSDCCSVTCCNGVCCPSGQACVQGQCVSPCPVGTVPCGTVCCSDCCANEGTGICGTTCSPGTCCATSLGLQCCLDGTCKLAGTC